MKTSTGSGRCTALGLPAVLVLILTAMAPAEPGFVETFADDPIASGRFFLPAEDPPAGQSQFIYQPETHSLVVRYHAGQPTARLVHLLGRALTHRDSFTLRTTFRIPSGFSSDAFAQISFGLMNATTGPTRSNNDPPDPNYRGAFDVLSFDYFLSSDYPTVSSVIASSYPELDYFGVLGYYGAVSFPAYNESSLGDPDESLLPTDTALEAVIRYDGAARQAVLRIYDGMNALPINLVGEDLETGGLDHDITTIVTPLLTDPEDTTRYPLQIDRIGMFSWYDPYWSNIAPLDVVFKRMELTWTVFPDLTGDGQVDADDVQEFQACETGPAITQENQACRNADLDSDDDVDQDDFGLLQRQLGTQRP